MKLWMLGLAAASIASLASALSETEQMEAELRTAPASDLQLKLDLNYDLGQTYIRQYAEKSSSGSIDKALLQRAITHYEKALEISSEKPSKRGRKKGKKAAGGLKRLTSKEEYQVWTNLARSYTTTQQHDLAVKQWEKLVEHESCIAELGTRKLPFEPCCFSMHMGYIVTHYHRIGNTQKAREWFDKAVEFRYRGEPAVYWTDIMQVPPWSEPDLEAKPFWSASDFNVSKILEDNYLPIMEDLERVMAHSFMGSDDEEIVSGGSWKEFLLCDEGKWDVERCKVARNTCQLLDNLPELFGTPVPYPEGSSPGQVTILKLSPGTKLRLHTGPKNNRLTLHLGLKVPDGTSIEVAGLEGSWTEGQVLAFDDSFVHKVAHNGTEDRYVLYVSVWHPDVWNYKARIPKVQASLARLWDHL